MQRPMAVACMRTDVTITFVHGTWAAERLRDDSRPSVVPYPSSGGWPLARALLERWPGTRSWLLRWSGKNSVGERRRAAAALVRHARAVERAAAGGLHVIVGHSHGGTVICYALRRAAMQRTLRGVVCLSTPFVMFSRRPDREARLLGGAVFLVALLPLLWLTGQTGDLWVSFALDEAAVAAPAPAPAAWAEVAAAIGGVAVLLGMRPLWRRARLAGERFLGKAALPALDGVHPPVLLVRSPNDEASGGLAASQFLAWLLLRLARAFMPFGRSLPTPREFMSGMATIFAISLVVALPALAAETLLGRAVSLPVVPVLLVMILAVPMLMLAFSRDTAAHALFVHTSVEPCPAGRWEIHQLGPVTSSQPHPRPAPWGGLLTGNLRRMLSWNPFDPFPHDAIEPSTPPLMHSITYQDARAIELVATFVATRVVGV